MAALKFKDDHNKVAFLGRAKGNDVFELMVDFLQRSKLRYALTHCPPVVYESLVKQFWATAEERFLDGQPKEIVPTIDGKEYVITESSVRTRLQLEYEGGVFNINKEMIVKV
jgi:hypothetical protein